MAAEPLVVPAPGVEPPALIQRVQELNEWQWQELELGSFQEVREAAEWIRILREIEPGTAWLLEWYLVRADLWYLVRYVSSQGVWIENGTAGVVREDWLFDRCRELEEECDKVVDAWSRFHWKSYLKTILKSIQEALRNPEITIVIFSHTRPIAKAFLATIQEELLGNERLRSLSWDPRLEGRFPDGQIFPENKKTLGRNSLNEGIIVPRIGNPKEATFSAYGLVDSLPTGGHWIIKIHDDAVVKDSVSTPDQINKVKHSWELSIPLGMPAGRSEEWVSGTFYALGDLYHTMIHERGFKLRLHPCYPVDWEGTTYDERGRISRLRLFFSEPPVLYEDEKLKEFETTMGAGSNVAMQLYCDPNAGAGGRSFEEEWLQFYEYSAEKRRELLATGNSLMLVDSAGIKRSGSDYTSIWTISLQPDGCAYVIDMCRDRLSLTERGDMVFKMHQRCISSFYECRYERYGMMADIEFIEFLAKQKKRRFRIIRVGGITDKDERIERLIPWFEDARLILPHKFMYRTIAGERVDLVEAFKYDEYLGFPNTPYKDMLDALSRIADTEGAITSKAGAGKKITLKLRWPKVEGDRPPEKRREYYRPKKDARSKIPPEQRWLVA